MAAIINRTSRVVSFDSTRLANRQRLSLTSPRLVAIWRLDGDGSLVREWRDELDAVSATPGDPLQRPAAA
jgi:hypothetical protein